MKIIWRVSERPTGRYRSFEKRSWPSAHFENGEAAALIVCDKQYYPADVKSGDHPELTVRVVDHSLKCWEWRTLKNRAKTLIEAKSMVAEFYKHNPTWAPKGL